eukprot:3142913-Lingulodinium_polyedra.AAC.1
MFNTMFMESGIKQGCPMAGILFVGVSEPLLRALVALGGRNVCTCTYYDDVGQSYHNLTRDISKMPDLLV